jgi:hypothetical protein
MISEHEEGKREYRISLIGAVDTMTEVVGILRVGWIG